MTTVTTSLRTCNPEATADTPPPRDMIYRVWWIPQVPMDQPFYVVTASVDTAIELIDTLASYDAYQYKHRVKPDYSNIGGIERWTGDEWEDVDEDYIADRQRALGFDE